MFHVFIFIWGILNYKHGLLIVFIGLFQSHTWNARLPEMMFAPALPAELWSAFVLRAPSLTERGGRSPKIESWALIWPRGTTWSPHPPCVRTPTPQLSSICKGNWPNLWLCVGGWGSWLSASTPTACPQEWRTTDILVLLDQTFGSQSSATGVTTSHPRLDHQEIKTNKQKKKTGSQFLQYLNNNCIGAIYFTICSLKLRWLHNALFVLRNKNLWRGNCSVASWKISARRYGYSIQFAASLCWPAFTLYSHRLAATCLQQAISQMQHICPEAT